MKARPKRRNWLFKKETQAGFAIWVKNSRRRRYLSTAKIKHFPPPPLRLSPIQVNDHVAGAGS